MRNADSLAWYAMAKYVQDRIGTYSHLPIVYKKANGPPSKDIQGLTTFANDASPVFNSNVTGNETLADNFASALNIDDGLPADNSCSDDLTPNMEYNADNSTVTTTSTLPTTTTAAPSGSSTCTGNQVESSSCIADTLPSATPYSGSQGPSCDKADGTPGSNPRLNLTAAQNAASQYCQNLVDTNVVLINDTGDPKPGTEAGAAEGGADMALTVMYDVSSCPQDKSNSTLDFGTLGVDACFSYLFTALSEVCAEDSTWANYNPQWTLEGGIYATSCRLFAINGVSG